MFLDEIAFSESSWFIKSVNFTSKNIARPWPSSVDAADLT